MDSRSPFRYLLALSAPLLTLLCAAARVEAQEIVGFDDRAAFTVMTRDFSDREIASLVTTLDKLLAVEKDPARWGESARGHLWNFVRQLQTGRLTPAQEALVAKQLDAIGRAHPADAPMITRARLMATTLTVGKTAPEIIGKDLDGTDLRLTDYRGKVVVLVFSADWCGICKTMNPYERLMMELYGNWPFAIVSVETGESREATRKVKADERLAYRSWWDAQPAGGAGPIASAWNVGGFPSIYVLDGRGVIRYVDLRYEDLLKGVRQLLQEETAITRNQSNGS